MFEVSGYRIEGEAGRGGWSVVYRAVQLSSGHPVAIKVIAPELAEEQAFRDRFRHECELAAGIDHPHVVPVIELGDGNMVMQWVEGTTLRELAPLEPARAAGIVTQVGTALDALHARGLVHRDVKPDNVLVEQRPEGDHAYLTDFGLAKEISIDPGLTEAGRWLGTVDYAAPEQIRGLPTDPRSDVYSLGCVLGFAVTGSPPYPRPDPEATMQAHMHEPPPLLGGPLDGVLTRALAKDPDSRLQSAGELAGAATTATRARDDRRRTLLVAALILASLIASIAVGVIAALSEAQEPPAEPDCTRIVIDPGHDSMANSDTEPIGPGSKTRKIKDGGGTRGVATGTPEHVLTLQISKRLRTALIARGYCVTMTRDRATGRSMGNVTRARIANKAKAALFVRIHADGSTNRSQHGTSMLYPALHKGWTDDVLPESKAAARLLQAELVARLGSRDNGIVERGDLTGFNWADVPVVLAEIGYMTNAAEDRRLGEAKHQKRAAIGLAEGIERFAPAG